ncbi:MAG: glycosyltransferase family 1 protein [Microgenomates group bacterium]
MVIGVDAGAICETDNRLKVGVYRVTHELLNHLATLDTTNSYRLYSFASIPRDIMVRFGNHMVNVALTPSVGYMRVRLPLHLRLHPNDLFLGLSQAIPVGVKHAIGFVYDLGFLVAPKEYGDSAERLKKQTEDTIYRSSHIITISETVKRDIINTYHIDTSRISVCLPGIADIFLSQGEESHQPRPYFLSVGLLKPSKHLPTAIRAFAKFLEQVKKPYDFIIIGGDAGLDPAIKQTIHELHLEKRVRLLGYVSDTDVGKWYRGAEALIALSTHEGFCLPAAEAMACGTPIIYANQGALPEIVGNAGVAVATANSNTIVDAFVRISQEKVRKEKQKAAYVQSKKYRWETFAASVFQVITGALAKNIE